MKKILYSLAGVAALALAASCSQEEALLTEGEGAIAISTTISDDVKVVSRSTEGLADECLIWISNPKGLVREYKGLGNVPDKIVLMSDHYKAEAWAGDSLSASFDKRWFKGETEFDVTKGNVTNVTINCKIANVVAAVNYAERIDEVLTDYTMTVGHDRGSLVFEGRDERQGYFMMPSTDKNLTYTIKGTQSDGSEFSHTGVIENVQPATKYILNVDYKPVTNEVGGAVFSIIVNKEEIEVGSEIKIYAAPKIEGYGFDISQPVMGASGTIGQKSVYVSSGTLVTSLVLKSPVFESISILGGDDFDFLKMNETGLAAVNEAGIFCNNETVTGDEGEKSLIKLVFSAKFVNGLDNGEYPITITANDKEGNTSAATLTLVVSDAPVQTVDVDKTTVSMRAATLVGRTAKEVASAGFRYREVGAEQWTAVEGVPSSRTIAADVEYTAQVTGLNPATEYEYATTCVMTTGTEFVGQTVKFTTLDGPQLPNASFEDWSTSGKAVIVCDSESNLFWDSGNRGSATMNKNVTQSDASVKHSGSYSAMLSSQFVGMGPIGKFAAGNLFIGKYLKTQGTDGVLGWGRQFDFSKGMPKAVKVWVKYTPKTITHSSISQAPKGQMDTGIIYAAITDDEDTGFNKYEDDMWWSVVVKTKKEERHLFSQTDANVIAYGEHVFDAATEGSGMVEITIPLDIKKTGTTPTRILMVASASRYGDYFTGGEGSTMWVDDVKLVY